ncbi:hypothetical protein VP01_679g3 [Puccinia sorghi]|uniref:Uncharacterized protein n=1 Tax=Puccinia sorghi TaxID=27349 RepID=A0A0L6UEH6_9BASI|nr:hypothetical protein VP01_679g3 [Puccinia sorghi]
MGEDKNDIVGRRCFCKYLLKLERPDKRANTAGCWFATKQRKTPDGRTDAPSLSQTALLLLKKGIRRPAALCGSALGMSGGCKECGNCVDTYILLTSSSGSRKRQTHNGLALNRMVFSSAFRQAATSPSCAICHMIKSYYIRTRGNILCCNNFRNTLIDTVSRYVVQRARKFIHAHLSRYGFTKSIDISRPQRGVMNILLTGFMVQLPKPDSDKAQQAIVPVALRPSLRSPRLGRTDNEPPRRICCRTRRSKGEYGRFSVLAFPIYLEFTRSPKASDRIHKLMQTTWTTLDQDPTQPHTTGKWRPLARGTTSPKLASLPQRQICIQTPIPQARPEQPRPTIISSVSFLFFLFWLCQVTDRYLVFRGSFSIPTRDNDTFSPARGVVFQAYLALLCSPVCSSSHMGLKNLHNNHGGYGYTDDKVNKPHINACNFKLSRGGGFTYKTGRNITIDDLINPALVSVPHDDRNQIPLVKTFQPDRAFCFFPLGPPNSSSFVLGKSPSTSKKRMMRIIKKTEIVFNKVTLELNCPVNYGERDFHISESEYTLLNMMSCHGGFYRQGTEECIAFVSGRESTGGEMVVVIRGFLGAQEGFEGGLGQTRVTPESAEGTGWTQPRSWRGRIGKVQQGSAIDGGQSSGEARFVEFANVLNQFSSLMSPVISFPTNKLMLCALLINFWFGDKLKYRVSPTGGFSSASTPLYIPQLAIYHLNHNRWMKGESARSSSIYWDGRLEPKHHPQGRHQYNRPPTSIVKGSVISFDLSNLILHEHDAGIQNNA